VIERCIVDAPGCYSSARRTTFVDNDYIVTTFESDCAAISPAIPAPTTTTRMTVQRSL